MNRAASRRASIAAASAAILVAVGLAPASADVVNGDFESAVDPWWTTANLTDSASIDTGALCVDVPGGTANPWDAIVGQDGLSLSPGDYVFGFDASSSTGTSTAVGLVQFPVDPWTQLANVTQPLTDEMTRYETSFTVDEDVTGLQTAFQVGGASDPWTFCVDNVSVAPAGVEQVVNGTFDDDLTGWTHYGFVDGSARVEDGTFCATVPAGTTNPWDVALFQDLQLVAGDYSFSFDASAAGPVRAIVQQEGGAYASYGEIAAGNDAEWTRYETSHQANDDPVDPRLGFQVGGAASEWEFCLDNVSYLGGVTVEPYEPETGPRVRVNQVGYLTHGPKEATLVTDATEPVGWELLDSADAVASSGMSVPLGTDESADQNVHGIDFSDVTATGTYTLVADGEASYEFEIGTDAYEQLRYDALNYFYLARSGLEIDGDIVGEEYARAAGHVSSPADGVANKGDLDVPCQNAADAAAVYTDGYGWDGCDYTLDVVGGWYDAGDHGKYVVNGGISAAQLLGTYERTKTAASAELGALADGTLNVPETGNDVPDVLDEARWQLEFMLAMQVPEGAQFAGMVHHKIHDDGWTGLPLMPANDAQVRELHRPSTAATLNLSATAAQGARLFAPYDEDFADELLAAARSTWAAALATPDLYAPVADGADGGGPYDDDDVTDEFYWAAAELFLTTGDDEYEDFLLASDVDGADDVADGFYWGSLAALAKLDLATVPNDYERRSTIVDQVIAGADALLAVQEGQEFGLALADDAFEWGSNSAVLNNQVILGTAFDLTGERAYADAVIESMDYLLGRNALNVSYVTEYGDVTSQNQHSRWFAHQLNAELPNPPAGSVAGGPNPDYGTWDPTIQGLYPDQDCAPQLCYVDHIQSWSTNEITVNWNAALSWVASWMADQGQAATEVAPCAVSYTVHGSWPAGYNTQVWITNTSDTAITDWSLTWGYPADDTVSRQAWSAQWSQEGAFVTAESMPWNGTIKPGKRTTIGFIGAPGTLADAPPEQFWVNGNACTTG
ncbi:glycoside hydrolase family 9 protein [Demequina muriae]|uniref:Endoglucanase n=1 Tax=Demequina muriae TaxID=3051664 RepID=A0ABT8GIQ1_9MICO|nr:glycoside hydrolase family 9 protein [Demequina sp. EGI L300058]MDN4481307.1 glycoside hydrolase family 9 protein [Demequina sp. EGI L300058]